MDPRLAISIAVHSNPGVYAVLVGSGVSRAAAIPTGWEIVRDLVAKVAVLQGVQPEVDPIEWYAAQSGSPPTYSELLGVLAGTPAERQAILRGYFEATPDELEDDLKVPTPAHRAIADLVAAGYVKVIVTTNFDRLVESALEERGIRPVVISSEDTARGAIPTAHVSCLVLKLNGDYLDPRIRNTAGELSKYPKPLRDRLDQICDEYGLIICGWSGEWDDALRTSLEASKGRRYTTFWTQFGDLSAAAESVVRHRDAMVIPIESADEFFVDLSEKVVSLQAAMQPHPLSPVVAEHTLKHLLASPERRIRLHDFVQAETEALYSRLGPEAFPMNTEVNPSTLHARMSAYEGLSAVLCRVGAVGAYWCESEHVALWRGALARIANPPGLPGGTVLWLNLRRYPALLFAYSTGIAAVFRSNYDLLHALLIGVPVRDINGREEPLVQEVNSWLIDHRAAQLLPGMERHWAPLSDWLQVALRPQLEALIPDEIAYVEIFDAFEYLVGLAMASLDAREPLDGRRRGPVGAFGWRWRRRTSPLILRMREEATTQGEDWALLRAGFFDGRAERFLEVQTQFDAFWKGLPWH